MVTYQFLLFVSKQCLLENIQGKFYKIQQLVLFLRNQKNGKLCSVRKSFVFVCTGFSKNNSRDYYNFAFDFCLVIQREIINISFVFFVPETEIYLRQVFMIRKYRKLALFGREYILHLPP